MTAPARPLRGGAREAGRLPGDGSMGELGGKFSVAMLRTPGRRCGCSPRVCNVPIQFAPYRRADGRGGYGGHRARGVGSGGRSPMGCRSRSLGRCRGGDRAVRAGSKKGYSDCTRAGDALVTPGAGFPRTNPPQTSQHTSGFRANMSHRRGGGRGREQGLTCLYRAPRPSGTVLERHTPSSNRPRATCPFHLV